MSNFEQLYSEYTKLEMLYERGDISRIQLNEAAINARKLNPQRFKAQQYDRLVSIAGLGEDDIGDRFLELKNKNEYCVEISFMG